MNVYVQFGLAMCSICLIALGATAYLAVVFNRRGKADLQVALTPLAELIEGTVNLEEAAVSGRYAGHLAETRLARASQGLGLVFQTDLIDPAGGISWSCRNEPSPPGGQPPKLAIQTPPEVTDWLDRDWEAAIAGSLDPARDRYRLDYDAAAGRLRLTVPMRTRRDIPSVAGFQRRLDALVALAQVNRAAQGAPDADWPGGRRGACRPQPPRQPKP